MLDLACGDGRNALFLLKSGFTVTGVDYSQTALNRLKRFAADAGYPVCTELTDLNAPDCFDNLGVYDNIVINHYRLYCEQFAALKDHVQNGGILYVCGFGHKHPADAKIRQEDRILPTDFDVIKPFFEIVQYSETQDERGFFVTYLLRKNEPA